MIKKSEIIANGYPVLKEYFPRLSSFLMTNLMQESKTKKETIFKKNSEDVMFVLCNYINYDQELKLAYEYTYDKLSDSDFLNKEYYDFVDGKLYGNEYSEDLVISLLYNSVSNFETLLDILEEESPTGIDTLINHLHFCCKEVVKKTEIDSELYANEYLEQIFLNILIKSMENTVDLNA